MPKELLVQSLPAAIIICTEQGTLCTKHPCPRDFTDNILKKNNKMVGWVQGKSVQTDWIK